MVCLRLAVHPEQYSVGIASIMDVLADGPRVTDDQAQSTDPAQP